MAARTTDASADDGATDREKYREAYDALNQAIKALDLSTDYDRYVRLQREYFDLKARLRALDPDFQDMDLNGRVSVPSSHATVGDNPVIPAENGEIEIPTKPITRFDGFRVLSSVEVCDPDNPHTTHGVTIDHVVTPDGEVTVEVNALELDNLAEEAGSHIR